MYTCGQRSYSFILLLFLKIQFWKTDDPDNVRTHDLVLGSVESCRDAPRGHRGRNKRATDEVAVAHVNNLWPFSKITAGVLAQNGAKSGALGPTLEFETPEGGKLSQTQDY